MRIHLIGIGGSGMRGLAAILKANGHTVTGCDATATRRNDGIKVARGHSPKHVTSGKHITHSLDLVIHSHAIDAKNEELLAAHANGIRTMSYPEALGALIKSRHMICVAGTHGKTTTTGMIASILVKAGRDPTVVVGANIEELDGMSSRAGGGEYAVIESCEYRKSFLHLKPTIAIITNIDYDHVDAYPTKAAYQAVFKRFLRHVPRGGVIIVHAHDKVADKLLKGIHAGTRGNINERTIIRVPNTNTIPKLAIPGEHNRKNAALGAALAKYLKIPARTYKAALRTFHGAARRIEPKGEHAGVQWFDDYAHHPVEITATIQALREQYPRRRIIAIFQPHQYSRTKAFLDDFARALARADIVLIPNIFAARDTKKDMSGDVLKKLIALIEKYGGRALHTKTFEATLQIIANLRKKGDIRKSDIVVTMGAGDIAGIYEKLN